jgi:hypothetical protein
MNMGLMTHPDHRRKGVFRSMVETGNRFTVDAGAQFSMSMPNDSSVSGYLKWDDWSYPGLIPLFVKVIDSKAALEPKLGLLAGLADLPLKTVFRRRRALDQHAIDIAPVTSVPEEIDEVANDFARDCDRLMIRRTAAYWNWRYGDKPDAEYSIGLGSRSGRVVGAVVTSSGQRMGMNVGMIIDLVARGGVPAIRALIRSAEEDLLSRSIGWATMQATSPLLQQALVEEGYRCPNPKILPKHFHLVFRKTGVAGLRESPDKLSHWNLTYGDSDNT